MYEVFLTRPLVVTAESFSSRKVPFGETAKEPFNICFIISGVQFLFPGLAIHQLSSNQLGVIQTYFGAVIFLW